MKGNDFDPENYDMRISNLLDFIKKQNSQFIREEIWLKSQNQYSILSSKKKKKQKSRAQKRKEELQNQIPKLKKINKFFNFY